MGKRHLAAVSLAALLSVPASAEAFSIGNHIALTNATLGQIRTCVAKHPGRWDHLKSVEDGNRVSALIGCNAKQDDVMRKFALWHFYSHGKPIQGRGLQGNRFVGSTSFEKYFELVAARLTPTAKVEAVYPAVGALLHYVQDAAVPAHVIPIFHPKPLWNGDNFDDYPLQIYRPVEDAANCGRLLDVPASLTPVSILSATIDGTLRAARADFPDADITLSGPPKKVERTAKSWSLFWSQERGPQGFAEYGCVGDRFGVTTDLKCKRSGVSVRIRQAAFTQFALARHTAAVQATAQLIAYGLRAKPKEDAFASLACPVANSKRHAELEVCDEAIIGIPGERCSAEAADAEAEAE